ncbi:MAG: hypothetical protein M1838_005807 [Thelocarpon superellum]|nr:MAG: hypothetical protein M1838_005807 [Thelocarpon superellum]
MFPREEVPARPFESSQASESTPRRRPTTVPLSIPYTKSSSEFLYGTSAVTAALQAHRRKLYKLYVYEGANREELRRDDAVRKMAQSAGVEAVGVHGDWIRLMDKLSAGRPHNYDEEEDEEALMKYTQGYILEASPLPKLPVIGLDRVVYGSEHLPLILHQQSREEEEINGISNMLPRSGPRDRFPLIVMLDGILDPGNLGAIFRSAYFFGVDAIAISQRNSAPISPVVLKASAGAAENIPLMSVGNPTSFVDNARQNGWKMLAAVAPMPVSSRAAGASENYLAMADVGAPLRQAPCLLVFGSEGDGLRWMVRKKADHEVGIEGSRLGQGGVDSLNVSVAAALLCQALLQPRGGDRDQLPTQPVQPRIASQKLF